MRVSYGPDSNVITDSQGRAVFLSDAEITTLAGSLQAVTAPAPAGDPDELITFIHPTEGPMPMVTSEEITAAAEAYDDHDPDMYALDGAPRVDAHRDKITAALAAAAEARAAKANQRPQP